MHSVGILRRLLVLTAIGTAILSLRASAAVLTEDVTLVAKSAALAEAAPTARTFTVGAAGPLVITLTDVGFPAPLTSVNLLVTRGTQAVERLTQFGTKQFNATPGVYSVQVIADNATAGTASVSIAPPAGGTSLLAFQTGIAGNPTDATAGTTVRSEKFTVTAAGSYQLSASDRGFPAALTSYDLLVVNGGGAPVARVCSPAIPPLCSATAASFNATVGEYDLFVNAVAADPARAGLLSIQVGGASSVYGATHPIGTLKSTSPIQLTVNGRYALSVSDFAFPEALTGTRVVVTQGGSQLLNTTTSSEFDASSGSIQLYSAATPGASGVGTFGINISRSGQSVFSTVHAAIGVGATGTRSFLYDANIASAAQYRIQTHDFAFPAAIPTLHLVAAQNGVKLGSASNGAAFNVNAAAGPLTLLILANTNSTTSSGLLSTTVEAIPATASPVFSATQPIGDLFHSRTLAVGSTGVLNLTLGDLAFPAAFADLALAVSRGNSLVGQVFGSGVLSFAATPGSYSLNVVARNVGTSDYGMYGLKVEDAPLPSVALIANASSVAKGGSANLSWTSTNATACTASDGWTGARATSGSLVAVGPLTSNAKFTLTCAGPGGTGASSVDVAVTDTASSSGGGGGAFGLPMVFILLGFGVLKFSRRFRFVHSV